MGRSEPYGCCSRKLGQTITINQKHVTLPKTLRKGLLLTTLDSPSTILKKKTKKKNGETSKITSWENWHKDRKFTVIAIEGGVRGTATRDFSPSRLHHWIV